MEKAAESSEPFTACMQMGSCYEAIESEPTALIFLLFVAFQKIIDSQNHRMSKVGRNHKI